jgi:phenylacetate-CoA ligase
MRFEFSHFPLSDRAFSEKPMTFCEPQALRFLSAILELAAIETGDRRARETWQASQLRNLLAHATERSPFWRARIGGGRPADALDLSWLPVLSRRELRAQVEAEGALLNAKDRIAVQPHSTSGSSGAPVRFFVSAMNMNYNSIRSTAQYFIEGRDLTLNRTALNYDRSQGRQGFSVERAPTWLGTLGPFVRSAANKEIKLLRPDAAALWRELSADPIGYLSIAPRLLTWLLQHVDPQALKEAGAAMVILIAEPLDSGARERLAAVGIPARATYSCEEVGPIGAECERYPGHYHVATSNVIVEVGGNCEYSVGDTPVGDVLLTHLHSYATPFIRYQVGDLASLADRCPCGHDGPTLANVVGRSKGLLKHAGGRLAPFYVPGGEMMAIAAFDEYRIRQRAPSTLVVEIGGRSALSEAETAAFVALVAAQAGVGFEVVVKAVEHIDWGENAKRLGFHNELL